ncbi:hypothetical protein ACX9R5_03305 [Rathayibacter sp. CAU 1779]
MRSLRPIPGNPWPHDMVITVKDDPNSLLDLLWIREAWRLGPEGDDLPPALVDTPQAVSETVRASAPVTEWRDAWSQLWRDCLRHEGIPIDPTLFDHLRAFEPGSVEYKRRLHELIGPIWSDRFGTDAFTDEHQRWQEQLFERHRAERPHTLDEQPERIALDALIPAWRAGLTIIVQIPCRGTFTRVVGEHALLLTAETRADPDRYREALASFR